MMSYRTCLVFLLFGVLLHTTISSPIDFNKEGIQGQQQPKDNNKPDDFNNFAVQGEQLNDFDQQLDYNNGIVDVSKTLEPNKEKESTKPVKHGKKPPSDGKPPGPKPPSFRPPGPKPPGPKPPGQKPPGPKPHGPNPSAPKVVVNVEVNNYTK